MDDMPPYNEFAVCIPLNSSCFLQVLGYNLLRQMLRMEYDMYFHHLPVTTEVARGGGIDFYGIPKFLASIDFTDTDESVACDLEEGGELICSFRGRKTTSQRSGIMKFFMHHYQYRQPQKNEIKMNALSYAMSFNPSDVE